MQQIVINIPAQIIDGQGGYAIQPTEPSIDTTSKTEKYLINGFIGLVIVSLLAIASQNERVKPKLDEWIAWVMPHIFAQESPVTRPSHINKPWMPIALKEKGVQEYSGGRNNPRIIKYHQSTSLKSKSDAVAWCASFVSYSLEKAGIRSTRSARARSYLNWGYEAITPTYGDIVIFRRGKSSTQGHVAFFIKQDKNNVYVLGGNQPKRPGGKSDRVSIIPLPKIRVIGYRTNTKPNIAKSKAQYIKWLYASEKRYNIPHGILAGVAWHESDKMRPDVVSGQYRNSGGDIGIMQFNPDTAKWLKIDATNPKTAINKAGWYLASLNKEFNDWSLALLAYNWGKGNLEKGMDGQINICSTHKIRYPVRVLRKSRIFGAKYKNLNPAISRCIT